jgi:hypothetical protein
MRPPWALLALLLLASEPVSSARPADAAAAAASTAAPPLRQALTAVLPVPSSAHDYNVQIATLALQGLANRAAPRLFLDTPVFWSSTTSQAWLRDEYIAPRLGFAFAAVTPPAPGALLCALLAALPAGTAAGLALFDDGALDASRWLAVTSGSLQALLPATRAMLADPLLAPCLAPLPVVVDYSLPAARGGAATNAGAVAWALRALRPACDATGAYSAGHSFADATETVDVGGDPAIDIGLDLAVARRLFTFNLSPDNSKYPAHAAEWEAVVASLTGAGLPDDLPSLLGWAEPEDATTMTTTKAGGAVVCDGAPNLSFWAALALNDEPRDGRAAASSLQLPYNRNEAALDAGACYVAVQSNEGDTPKIAAALQQGAWLDPRRGTVPIAWGVDPLTATLAPDLWGLYASTATANDTFFAATAGAGYAYPWSMPDMAPYVARAARLVAGFTAAWPAGSWHVDIWDNNRLSNLSVYANFSRAAGLELGSFSMQPEEMPGFSGALPDGTALVIAAKDLWYPTLNASRPLDDLRARVAAVCAAGPLPRFTVIYGNLLDGLGLNVFDYAAAAQQVPGVRVVGMQDLTALAREAAAAAAASRSAAAASTVVVAATPAAAATVAAARRDQRRVERDAHGGHVRLPDGARPRGGRHDRGRRAKGGGAQGRAGGRLWPAARQLPQL